MTREEHVQHLTAVQRTLQRLIHTTACDVNHLSAVAQRARKRVDKTLVMEMAAERAIAVERLRALTLQHATVVEVIERLQMES